MVSYLLDNLSGLGKLRERVRGGGTYEAVDIDGTCAVHECPAFIGVVVGSTGCAISVRRAYKDGVVTSLQRNRDTAFMVLILEMLEVELVGNTLGVLVIWLIFSPCSKSRSLGP